MTHPNLDNLRRAAGTRPPRRFRRLVWALLIVVAIAGTGYYKRAEITAWQKTSGIPILSESFLSSSSHSPLSLPAETVVKPTVIATSTPNLDDFAAAFDTDWWRNDKLVATGKVDRAWVWGPSETTESMMESYDGARAGQRLVRYYDKGRMEYNQNSPIVTYGLLAWELLTGQLQLGDHVYESRAPADINVIGDLNDANSPTYSSFTALMDQSPESNGSTIVQTLSRDGAVRIDESLEHYNVTATQIAAGNHSIASVFWDYLNSSGYVVVNRQVLIDKLFRTPLEVTGYPLTEAYWATVRINGTSTIALIQVFERRILSFVPSNRDGWKIESGNIGQHYRQWRYGSD